MTHIQFQIVACCKILTHGYTLTLGQVRVGNIMVWVRLGRGLVEEIEPMSNSAQTFIACCLAQAINTT